MNNDKIVAMLGDLLWEFCQSPEITDHYNIQLDSTKSTPIDKELTPYRCVFFSFDEKFGDNVLNISVQSDSWPMGPPNFGEVLYSINYGEFRKDSVSFELEIGDKSFTSMLSEIVGKAASHASCEKTRKLCDTIQTKIIDFMFARVKQKENLLMALEVGDV